MKAPAFDYVRPASIDEAVALLTDDNRECALLSGGQSLVTLMNFRMARPDLVIDISAIEELRTLRQGSGEIRIGAAVTHAAIEDSDLIGPVGEFLTRVASGIAFRAIRNRGTIGGSLAHADPSADWLTALSAVAARVRLFGPDGSRELPVSELVLGAMETVLEPGEIIVEIVVPEDPVVIGWRKSMRKSGEFAEALATARSGPDSTVCWIGALGGRPFAVTLASDLPWPPKGARLSDQALMLALKEQIAQSAPEVPRHRQQLAAVAACDAVADAAERSPL